MRLQIFQVDAFADRVFAGNPAAVCPLAAWLPDDVLQNIARENALSETAFLVETEDGYHLRWFTPEIEVALCGHATLASGFVILEELKPGLTQVRFTTERAGPLEVRRAEGGYAMDLPAQPAEAGPLDPALEAALGASPVELWRGTKWVAVFEEEETVATLAPDFRAVAALPCQGVVATAPGRSVDFVSRFFAPKVGVDEDPVTGSAHTVVTPYWAKRLKKDALSARQISRRGGALTCTLSGDRVTLAGSAVLYLRGEIWI